LQRSEIELAVNDELERLRAALDDIRRLAGSRSTLQTKADAVARLARIEDIAHKAFDAGSRS
jgi:hypothetical protein